MSSHTCEEKPDKNYKEACGQGYCPTLEERKNIRITELANKLRVESTEETLTNVLEWQNKNISYFFERNQLFVALWSTTWPLIIIIGAYAETLFLDTNRFPFLFIQTLFWCVVVLGSATVTLWLTAIVMIGSYRKLPLRQLLKVFWPNIPIDWILENRLCVCRDYAKLTACFLLNLYPKGEVYFFHARGHVTTGIKSGARVYVLDKWLPVVTIDRWHERWHKGIIDGRACFRTVKKIKGASLESVPLENLLSMTNLPMLDNEAKLENELKTRLGIQHLTIGSKVVPLKVWEWKKGAILYEDNEIVNYSLARRFKMLISDLMLEANDIANIRVDRKKEDMVFYVDMKTAESLASA